jgi:hypothetical protein
MWFSGDSQILPFLADAGGRLLLIQQYQERQGLIQWLPHSILLKNLEAAFRALERWDRGNEQLH